MAKRPNLKRKSFFVDEATLKRAKRLLRAGSDAETIRLSLERISEMERYWRFMDTSKAKLEVGSFEEP